MLLLWFIHIAYMVSSEDYTKVSIPKGLSKKIKEYIENNSDLGYKSVAEFVKEVIRNELSKREDNTNLREKVIALEKILDDQITSKVIDR